MPDKYTGSVYTYSLRGMAAKAKANAAQGIFALPVYDDDGEVNRYNVFHASLVIRYAKMYLYDIMDIKKETSNPFES